MGKFGNRRLPKFMEDSNQERPEPIQEEHDQQHEIVSLNSHGQDHAMITVRTQDGEEFELKFNYDGQGLLHAEHNGNTYTIPVEIEVVTGDNEPEGDEEIDETEVDHLRPGGKYKFKSPSFEDDIEFEDEVPQERGSGMYKFKGKGAAHLLPKKHVEDWVKDENDERAYESFTSYVIEEDCPECGSAEQHEGAMSEDARGAIKQICEGLLIHEAHQHDSDEHPEHTYESYLTECSSYLAECMLRSATNYKVGGHQA